MRIDETDERDAHVIRRLIDERAGVIPPIDLCEGCYHSLKAKTDVDHPQYSDGIYYCTLCGAELDEDD